MAKVFKGKTIEKGIAFPTCVSINRCGASRGNMHSTCPWFNAHLVVSVWQEL